MTRDGVRLQPSDRAVVVDPGRHHPLAPEPEAGHADWFLEQLASWQGPVLPVAAFVPSQFPAVARALHRHQATGELDEVTARTLVEVLGPATKTSKDVFFAV